MSSTSSAASAAFPSDSSEQECELSPSASVTSSAAQSSESTGPMSPALMTFAPLMQTDWVGSDESTSSAADSRANPSATPGNSKLRLTTVTSGRRCAKLLHSQDQIGSLVRTLLASSRWHSTMCWLTWKVSGTPRGRLLFRLLPSMRDTDGTASGSLLATPTAKANQLAPSMKKWKSCAALLPTPQARDYKGAAQRAKYGDESSLPAAVGTHITGGSLNPPWLEWLMGFPEGWTDLEPSEMPSSRKSSKKSGEQS